jgi:hypothetical protein
MRPLLVALSLAAALQATSGHLDFKAPAGWHTRPPSSTMRVAEFVIPHAAGDADDAELIVYFFGAQGGGSAQANIDRWIGQMQEPDGQPAKQAAKTEMRTINGLSVSSVDVSGTYVAEMRPGASEHFNKPGYRLIAAEVETPGGQYYIKVTGPARTVAGAKADIDKFFASLSYSVSAD